MSDQMFNLNNTLCFQLYVASKEIIRRYKPHLAPLGLTYTGFITLVALDEPTSLRDLGTKLFLDSGTLSPLLKKLESQGLIQRSRSSEDERTIIITFTQEGENLKAKLPAIASAVFKELQSAHPEVDFKHLHQELLLLNGMTASECALH